MYCCDSEMNSITASAITELTLALPRGFTTASEQPETGLQETQHFPPSPGSLGISLQTLRAAAPKLLTVTAQLTDTSSFRQSPEQQCKHQTSQSS